MKPISDATLVALLTARLRELGAFQLFALKLGPRQPVRLSVLCDIDTAGDATRIHVERDDFAGALLAMFGELEGRHDDGR